MELNWCYFICWPPGFNVDRVCDKTKANVTWFFLFKWAKEWLPIEWRQLSIGLIYLPTSIYFRVYFSRTKYKLLQLTPQTYLDIFLNLFYYQTNLIHTLWIKSNKLPITNLEKNNHNKEQNQTNQQITWKKITLFNSIRSNKNVCVLA